MTAIRCTAITLSLKLRGGRLLGLRSVSEELEHLPLEDVLGPAASEYRQVPPLAIQDQETVSFVKSNDPCSQLRSSPWDLVIEWIANLPPQTRSIDAKPIAATR
jgi:hypothetical protein